MSSSDSAVSCGWLACWSPAAGGLVGSLTVSGLGVVEVGGSGWDAAAGGPAGGGVSERKGSRLAEELGAAGSCESAGGVIGVGCGCTAAG